MKKHTAHHAIHCLVNGRLTEAKESSKDIPLEALYNQGVTLGWSDSRSIKASLYLKGAGSFYDYCISK
jgi:hypothetical protein